MTTKTESSSSKTLALPGKQKPPLRKRGGFFVPERQILSEVDIFRILKRLAHEVVEKNRGTKDLVLVGLRTRGAPLAQRLATLIESFTHQTVPVGILDITLYRDDLKLSRAQRVPRGTQIPVEVTDRVVVLVDDVLFTGRSARAAMDALVDWGRPRKVQLAVLVDRGHREMPIKADYVGKNIPSSNEERVQVRVKEVDGVDEVVLLRGAKANPTEETRNGARRKKPGLR